MMNKRLLTILLVFAMLASLSFATVSAQDEAGGGGTLVGAFDVGPGGAPQVIPYFDTAGRDWLAKIWSPLVSWDKTMSSLIPEIAVEWYSNDDATVWTFELREDVLWHDGETLTADDVVFSLNLALNPDAVTSFPTLSQLSRDSVVSVTAVDELTVQIELDSPRPRLPFFMIFLWILPEHELSDINPAEYQNLEWFFTNPIGTGPFMHDEFVDDQFWALVPNPNYFRGAPRLDRLVNRYFGDETSAILALEAGEIDFTYASGDVALALVDQFDLYEGPSGVTNYFIFNLRDPRLADLRVRQAMLYAIDRETIAETILEGTAEVVPCISPFPAMWPDESELNDYAYNPELARELLEEADWDGALTIELITYYDSQFHLDAMAAQQAFLADVGVNVVPVTQDVPTYNSYFYTGEGWDISYRGIGVNVGNFPFSFYVSGGWDTVDGLPLAGEEFPELVELLEAAQVEADPDTYLELLQEICRFQNEYALEGYMWTATRFGVASPSVRDFHWFPAAGGGPYETDAHLWYIED